MNDKDLVFLNECNNEQLKMILDLLLYDTDGKTRYAEELTTLKVFKENYPTNLKPLIPNIINELQLFGGNTVNNMLRGHGVCYREILEDVANKMKVPFNDALPIEIIEQYLLQQILITSVDKMTEEDIKHYDKDITKEEFKKKIALLKAGSPLFIKLTATIVIQLLAKQGLKQAALILGKFVGSRAFTLFAGPVGLVLSGIWATYDIAGPAFRVTIPCTITIAYLRMIYNKSEEDLDSILS